MSSFKKVLFVVGAVSAIISLTYRESVRPSHTVLFIRGNKLFDIMEKDNSFSNNFIFAIIDILTNLKNRIETGEYPLNYKENTYSFILRLLCNGFIKHKITFREGITVRQIVDKLDKEPILCGKITELPAEGSLMPDTYFYKFGDTRQGVLNKMKDEMEKFKKQVSKLNKTNFNWNDIVTLGSLIELEAGFDKDRTLISSVLHNRLQKGQRLEIDATVVYALTLNDRPVNRTRITHNDLSFKSPYNTYRNKGLPPGPICCPSRASILAAMNPAKTKYYFYVSDIYTKETFYSETFQQHVKNKLILKKRHETVA